MGGCEAVGRRVMKNWRYCNRHIGLGIVSSVEMDEVMEVG